MDEQTFITVLQQIGFPVVSAGLAGYFGVRIALTKLETEFRTFKEQISSFNQEMILNRKVQNEFLTRLVTLEVRMENHQVGGHHV